VISRGRDCDCHRARLAPDEEVGAFGYDLGADNPEGSDVFVSRDQRRDLPALPSSAARIAPVAPTPTMTTSVFSVAMAQDLPPGAWLALQPMIGRRVKTSRFCMSAGAITTCASGNPTIVS